MAGDNPVFFKRFSVFIDYSIGSKLNYKKNIVAYLDEENILKKLECKVIEYIKNIDKYPTTENVGPSFIYTVSLDFLRMQECNDELFQFFLWEPEMAMDATREVILRAVDLVTLGKRIKNFDKEIIIRLIGVPKVLSDDNFFGFPSTELRFMEGILVALSTPFKYIKSTVYNCKTFGCPGNNKERHFEDYSYNRSCRHCFGPIYKDVRSQEVGEKTACLFNVTRAYKAGGIFQPFIVEIKDQLFPAAKLQLGQEYIVIGKSYENPFEAMGIHERILAPLHYSDIHQSDFVSLPSSISQIYLSVKQTCENSPWAFVAAIASTLGSDILPNSSFLHIKMGLLLSLVAESVPLLGVGEDTSVANRLYRIAGRLANRYITSEGFRYMGGVIKSGDQDGVVWHEAGPLVLGMNGVCDLSDWAKYKKIEADYILRTIDRGQIVFDNETEEKNLMYAVPLKCSVWTFWNHRASNRKNLPYLKALISVFGIPFLIDEKQEMETKKVCSKYLYGAETAAENNSDLNIPQSNILEKELKEYLAFVKTGTVTVSEEASELIKKYFVASRKERPDALPLGAIKTITALSEAHARISMRTEVLYEDVAAVIYLYQESISDLFEKSHLDFLPRNLRDPKEIVYIHFDKVLQEFIVWLDRYVQMFTSDIY